MESKQKMRPLGACLAAKLFLRLSSLFTILLRILLLAGSILETVEFLLLRNKIIHYSTNFSLHQEVVLRQTGRNIRFRQAVI